MKGSRASDNTPSRQQQRPYLSTGCPSSLVFCTGEQPSRGCSSLFSPAARCRKARRHFTAWCQLNTGIGLPKRGFSMRATSLPPRLAVLALLALAACALGNPCVPPVVEEEDGGGVCVGCSPTTPGAFPYFVALTTAYNRNGVHCGGTLITPDVVVTAAHCVRWFLRAQVSSALSAMQPLRVPCLLCSSSAVHRVLDEHLHKRGGGGGGGEGGTS